MVVWSGLEASCPMCSKRIPLRLVGSGFFTGQDTDLFLRMPGEHVIQVDVHTCPDCRFSGYPDDFQRDVPQVDSRRFLSGEPLGRSFERLRIPRDGVDLLPDVQYYWASRSAGFLRLPAREQADRLLRAYWCLRLPACSRLRGPALDARRSLYLSGAIALYREANRAPREPRLLYLIGELCRRHQNFRLAVAHFREFLDAGGGPKYLQRAAEKLAILARDRIWRELTMEEVLFDRTPDGNRP